MALKLKIAVDGRNHDFKLTRLVVIKMVLQIFGGEQRNSKIFETIKIKP